MSEFLQYGGQAVIEGVMMRSPRFFSVACRRPDQTIVVQTEPVERTISGRLKWLNKPFLRGTLALVDAMALGTRALTYSARIQAAALGPAMAALVSTGLGLQSMPDTDSQPGPGSSRINDIAIGATLVFAMCFGLVLFIALPTALTQLCQQTLGVTGSVARNALDGFIRIAIFLGYIALIARMPNVRRVFQYHGAEHKAINTLEAGEDLTLDNCLAASRIHPRCGTSFIIIVLLASILVHSIFPRPDFYLTRLALHLSLIPVVAGFAYEVIRLAGRFRNASILRFLLAPGLWSQRLTTREPLPDQVEVAIAALKAVLAEERAAAPVGAVAAAVA